MPERQSHPRNAFDPAAVVLDTEVVIALIADRRIREAIDRGEFDDLSGSGQPVDLPDRHDPDWWFKNLMKREGLVMVPSSIQLRIDDAALDEQLDRLPNESAVRQEVKQVNERVIRARYELPAGPPLITMPRDLEATVAAWKERRVARSAAAHRAEARSQELAAKARRRFRRRPRRRRSPTAAGPEHLA